MIFALHRLYERKCRDCGYVWTVPRANAAVQLHPPPGMTIARSAWTSYSGDGVGSVEADYNSRDELLEAIRRCPKCGVDNSSIRAITRRHPASPPRVGNLASPPSSEVHSPNEDLCPQTREGSTMEVAALADLLHETADHHGAFEKIAPKHDWWDWYAAYMSAREGGSTSEQASQAAGEYMDRVKGIRVP
jgi:hypothetical protein